MFYVYILRSQKDPAHFYTGFTKDLKRRLAEHNRSEGHYASTHAPWNLQWYSAFEDETRAHNFETYLKSGSGREFAKRHL
jgi:predicted GIY-YIG superfamily endonuclease